MTPLSHPLDTVARSRDEIVRAMAGVGLTQMSIESGRTPASQRALDSVNVAMDVLGWVLGHDDERMAACISLTAAIPDEDLRGAAEAILQDIQRFGPPSGKN